MQEHSLENKIWNLILYVSIHISDIFLGQKSSAMHSIPKDLLQYFHSSN